MKSPDTIAQEARRAPRGVLHKMMEQIVCLRLVVYMYGYVLCVSPTLLEMRRKWQLRKRLREWNDILARVFETFKLDNTSSYNCQSKVGKELTRPETILSAQHIN